MKVYLGLPIYGQADAEFISALLKTRVVLDRAGFEVEVDINTGCSVVSKARNDITQRFFASGFDKLLFIDSDMVWNPVDAVKLLLSPYDFCGIAYRSKSEGIRFNAVANGEVNEGWIGADAIGTGFMCLTRKCVDRMRLAYPQTAYTDDSGDEVMALFDFEIHNGKYWGEDYTFCRRWKGIGGDIWMMPAQIGHIGKKTYSGNIANVS
jgi:hypothetical protein